MPQLVVKLPRKMRMDLTGLSRFVRMSCFGKKNTIVHLCGLVIDDPGYSGFHLGSYIMHGKLHNTKLPKS